MNLYFSEQIERLASLSHTPIYAVGGYVRNFLIDKSLSFDLDIAAPIPFEDFINLLKKVNITPNAIYKRTGTVQFTCDDGQKVEFTCFRNEIYGEGGSHKPIETIFTTDILTDAMRRDFKCNAVYYDIKDKKIVDPLGGVEDIKNRVLDTVTNPQSVFMHDGLRLMRLARFCAQLNFKPTQEVLRVAKEYSKNVLDISPERIYDELKQILVADSKYSFSDKNGHYTALKILSETTVLDYIIPELTLGKDMAQRADYHNYTVLEHTLKTVLYAPSHIRLSALLHDVGKPKQMQGTGKFYMHDVVGEKIAKDIMLRLKVDNKTVQKVCFLTKYHMYDMDCKTGVNKVKRFIVDNLPYIDDLLLLKQADYSGCKDDLSVCKTVEKWKNIINCMKQNGLPFSLKDLAITAQDVINLGAKGSQIANILNKIFYAVIECNAVNDRQNLIKLANSLINTKS